MQVERSGQGVNLPWRCYQNDFVGHVCMVIVGAPALHLECSQEASLNARAVFPKEKEVN